MKDKKKMVLIISIILFSLLAFLLIYLLVFKSNNKTSKNITTTKKTTTTVKGVNTSLSSGSVTTTIDGKSITYKAAYLVDGIDATISSGTYESSSQDEVVFLVINGGTLTINKGVTINDNGTSSNNNNDNYDFYGTNSAIVVVGSGSKAIINGVTVTTNAIGANAVFATNKGNVDIKNSTISTSQNKSRGLDATYEGVITADSVKISTKGGSCATLATDRGEGTVTASNMSLSTEGAGSPIIYSTGNITLSNSTGTATGSQIAVIEGKNSITIKKSKLSANGIGNRNSVDNCAVMIYQSMSGDASVGTGSFTATDSTLTILKTSSVYSSVPFFFITNTNATINLTNNTISYGSGALISSKGTSEWGNSGSNGGKLTMSVNNQILNGTITSDSLSSIAVSLTNNSKYTGTTSGTVSVTTDSTSSKN